MTSVKSLGRRGLSLLEVALALGVMAIGFVGIAQFVAHSASETRATAAAQKIEQIAHAGMAYLRSQKTQLEAAFGPDPSAVLTVPVGRQSPVGSYPVGSPGLVSLQEAGLLASGFVDTNAAGQSHVLLVRRISAGLYEGLVTAMGGTPFADADLASIANGVGAAGGAVYDDITPTPDTHLVGAYGGWSYPVTAWSGVLDGAAVAPAAGRPAVSLDMAADPDGRASGTFLSRVATADPADTAMTTSLSMGGHSIIDVDSLTASGRIATQELLWSRGGVATDGYIWSRGNITSEGGISTSNAVHVGTWLHSEGGIGTHGSVYAPRGNVNAQNFCDQNGNRCLYGSPSGWLNPVNAGYAWNGNMLFQWGKVCPGFEQRTYNFVVPFPNNVLQVIGTRDTHHPGATRENFSLNAISPSQFTASNAGMGGCTNWLAIGF